MRLLYHAIGGTARYGFSPGRFGPDLRYGFSI